MKAVIPAAGLGTRFLPLTKEQPKEMLPVVDRPTIHWVVQEAIASGADDILIITGREKRSIEDYFDSSFKLEHYLLRNGKAETLRNINEITRMADIHYVRQKEPRGLGDAILHAEKHVGREPFLVILGDTINVANPPVAKQLMEQYERLRWSVIAVEHVRPEKISDYGIVDGRKVGERLYEVGDMVEKPAPQEAPSDLGISGTYVLTPTIFDCLRRTKPGRHGEVQLTDGLRLLIGAEKVYAYEFQGRRYDIGTKMDWFRTHLELLLQDPEFGAPMKEFMAGLVRDG
jgi:UTP--glucose-1-phosphate uridylyltransferase